MDSEAHSNEIISGPNKGESLHTWFVSNRERYGLRVYERLPLIMALVDARDDLSIQVHPNDQKAKEIANLPFGKMKTFMY